MLKFLDFDSEIKVSLDEANEITHENRKRDFCCYLAAALL